MSFAASLTKLKSIVDLVSSSVLPQTYAYLETMPASFPAVSLTYVSHREARKDTISNELDINYLLRIFWPSEERVEAQAKWLALLDTLSAELRKDDHQTLDGSVASYITSGGDSDITTEFGQPVIVFRLSIGVKLLKTINS